MGLRLSDEAGYLPLPYASDTVGGSVVYAVPDQIGICTGSAVELDRSGVGERVPIERYEDVLERVEGAAAVAARVDRANEHVEAAGRRGMPGEDPNVVD